MWAVVYTKQAHKDAQKIKAAGLKEKVEKLLDIISVNPPAYKHLVGDLGGAYSRRITFQHRLVYQVLKKERVVKILRLWTHYE